MHHAADSRQWQFIDEKWPEFASEARNIRLGLAIDGINPSAEKRSTWSTWPVMFLNYNVSPWMTTKNHFVMLSMIISSQESVTGDSMDVYLEPLLEELQ